jgi:lipoprotein-anchoring transpeptidase ErfK/SrfK
MRTAGAICAGLLAAVFLGAGPVFGQPQPELQLFQAKVKEFGSALQTTPALESYSLIQRENVVDFIVGNVLFVLLHETGHNVMSEYRLPVFGRQEDAADGFAVLTLLKVGSPMSLRVLVEAARGWFLSDRRDQRNGEKLLFYDEHGLDQQRAYQIVCLMVGSDPVRFAGLAKDVKLPEERRQSCQNDYANLSSSWDAVMQAHRRDPAQPKLNIEVIYGDGKREFDVYAQGFRSIQLLETLKEYITGELNLLTPFTMETQTCGYINGFWDGANKRLVLCYELAADFGELYRVQGMKLRTTFGAIPIEDQPGYVPSPEAERLPAIYQRQTVFYRTAEAPGTIIVSPSEHFLYVVQGKNRALPFGIGVGGDCLQWSGLMKLVGKAEWPDWTASPEAIARQPNLVRFMAGGPGNPLGARQLDLGNAACRIHGTNQPQTIGQSVRSGSFRLANADVIDLYGRVPVGTKVIVRRAPET